MITYDYGCTKCDTTTEAVRSLEERSNCPPCSACGSETTKILTSMNFKLKGRGWSSDGYSNMRDKADLV